MTTRGTPTHQEIEMVEDNGVKERLRIIISIRENPVQT